MKILVTGAGGFIGGHLVKSLLYQGFDVRAVDCKPFEKWYQKFENAENHNLDLTIKENCNSVSEKMDQIYSLACNMGGIGFIEQNRVDCMFSVLINAHMLQAALKNDVSKYFFSSTACVYNKLKQNSTNVISLKEEDAYPAMPEEGYGWEKIFTEQLCTEIAKETRLEVRIARLHNVYGPYGTWYGGREKAPAALCRKVALVKMNKLDCIEIWGDGTQMRSFMYIDDCIEGIQKIMNSDIKEPLNLGSSEAVSINQLVEIIENIAEIKCSREYNSNMPLGVVGRNSDNTKIKSRLNWEPSISLKFGIKNTYDWIFEQCKSQF